MENHVYKANEKGEMIPIHQYQQPFKKSSRGRLLLVNGVILQETLKKKS